MKAYKGFTKDLRATLGKGRSYKANELVKESSSKCARTGLHCAENPLDCFTYYGLCANNVFWLVEAGGSMDEDGSDSKIACTEMKLVKELSIKELAGHAMMYMVNHPLREWERNNTSCVVAREEARGCRWMIAIARGENPQVQGSMGAVLGLLREVNGEITAARVIEIDGIQYQPEQWYVLDGQGNVCSKEVESE